MGRLSSLFQVQIGVSPVSIPAYETPRATWRLQARCDVAVTWRESILFHRPCRALVLAALRAALRNSAGPFVRTALRAARWRLAGPRFTALECACRDRELWLAEADPSRRSARLVARDRLADGVRPCDFRPRARSRLACSRTAAE